MRDLTVPVVPAMSHAEQLVRPGQKPIGHGANRPVPQDPIVPPLPVGKSAGAVPPVGGHPLDPLAPTVLPVNEYRHEAFPDMAVLPALCQLGGNYTQATVVVESLFAPGTRKRWGADAIEQLSGPAARHLATLFAQTYGIRSPHVTRVIPPYAVDAAGQPCEKPSAVAHRYRTTVLLQEAGRI